MKKALKGKIINSNGEEVTLIIIDSEKKRVNKTPVKYSGLSKEEIEESKNYIDSLFSDR